jgi:hypothetical protein
LADGLNQATRGSNQLWHRLFTDLRSRVIWNGPVCKRKMISCMKTCDAPDSDSVAYMILNSPLIGLRRFEGAAMVK